MQIQDTLRDSVAVVKDADKSPIGWIMLVIVLALMIWLAFRKYQKVKAEDRGTTSVNTEPRNPGRDYEL